METTLGKTHT